MKNSLKLLSVIALSTIMFNHVYSNLVYAKSESNPYRFFWKSSGHIEKSGYVMFDIDTDYLKAKLVKSVGCAAGDTLLSQNGIHQCNEKVLGYSFKEDNKGVNLNEFEFQGQIPAGKFFALGQHPLSYDSRYFGLVDMDQVTPVIPIF